MKAEAFIIHLGRAEARKVQVDRLTATLPLPVNVVDAVDGLALGDDEIEAAYRRHLHGPRYPFALRKAEIGCFLSHRKAWQAIVDGGLDAGLIVEDDVEPIEGSFGPALALAMRTIRAGDYIRFPYRSHTDSGAEAAKAGEVTLVEPVHVGLGMQMQLVGRQAAAELLKMTETFDRPVDTTIQMRWLVKIRILAVRPPAVRQIGHLLGGTVVQKKVKPLGEVLSREIKRAWYRLALRRRNSKQRKGN
ncbi:glycosyltransferase family 25 protein [Mesorhizobium sp. LHD-90]|uniref:glycosyltransferase family 25 protein n=1 Tax=Mesorhizobium sp. LHD-90 TaxID=3071414 RepID=UPI0027E13F50|nr:glycosyltransferase family 25 protein [Mesorhizobium sp. LHD-90]MDQ6436496.1 glycosyltransferase family 25 protein [Mesorhizobium sp. LHD-90]